MRWKTWFDWWIGRPVDLIDERYYLEITSSFLALIHFILTDWSLDLNELIERDWFACINWLHDFMLCDSLICLNHWLHNLLGWSHCMYTTLALTIDWLRSLMSVKGRMKLMSSLWWIVLIWLINYLDLIDWPDPIDGKKKVVIWSLVGDCAFVWWNERSNHWPTHDGPAGYRPAGHEHMSRDTIRRHTMVQRVWDHQDMLLERCSDVMYNHNHVCRTCASRFATSRHCQQFHCTL